MRTRRKECAALTPAVVPRAVNSQCRAALTLSSFNRNPAADFNHRTERALSKSALATYAAAFASGGAASSSAADSRVGAPTVDHSSALPPQRRPTALIVGCGGTPSFLPQVRPPPPATATAPQRAPPNAAGGALDAADAALAGTVVDAMSRGGCVLLPTDSAGRCLELLVRLDSVWSAATAASTSMYRTFPLVFASPVAPRVLTYARTMLEYCTESLTRCVCNMCCPDSACRQGICTIAARLRKMTTGLNYGSLPRVLQLICIGADAALRTRKRPRCD